MIAGIAERRLVRWTIVTTLIVFLAGTQSKRVEKRRNFGMGNSGSQWNKWEGPFLFPRRPFASSRSPRSILLPFLLFRSPITQATITKGQQRSQGDWAGELSPLPTFYFPLQVTCQSAPHPPPLQKIRLPCSHYTETTQTSISIRWCLFIKVSHSATLLATCPHQGYFFFWMGYVSIAYLPLCRNEYPLR